MPQNRARHTSQDAYHVDLTGNPHPRIGSLLAVSRGDCFGIKQRYQTVYPPSMRTFEPVMKLEASDAR